MLNVLGKKIYLTRGDTAYLDVSIKDSSGNDYEPAQGDKIYFRLKKSIYKDELLVEKEINTDTLVLEIRPEDTSRLEFGTYCYEIELVTGSGQHFTVIENACFTIGAELEVH